MQKKEIKSVYMVVLPFQFAGLEGPAAEVLVPDTTTLV